MDWAEQYTYIQR